jgi:putative ABC transport system permease protein
MILQRSLVPALRTLRTYWGTAVLLAAAGAAALAVMLPVTSLAALSASGITSRLALHPMPPADAGIVWSSLAQSPTAIREVGTQALYRLLLGAAAGVLGVAWFTTLSLSTARATGCATEIGVRRAVGASRWNLLAAALLEGGFVAALALVVGASLGIGAGRLALGAWPGTVGRAAAAPNVLAASAIVLGLVIGALLPLVHARRSSRIARAEPTPLGLVVPVVQLGLSLVVLSAASLVHRGAGMLTAPTSATANGGEVFEITMGDSPRAERAEAYASVLGRIETDPTITAASLMSPGSLVGLGVVDNVTTDCGDCVWGALALPWHQVFATHYLVSADTFRALGMPVVAGRGITGADRWDTARVAVVSRNLAERHFQAGDAVGRQIRVGRGPDPWYTVVGVVENQRPVGFGGGLEPPFAVYLSVLQHPAPTVDLLVRARPGTGLVPGVVRLLHERLGARVRIAPVSEARLLAAEAAPLTWFARMFAAQGWAMLAVATIGTFAVMWLWVTSLLGELGVRRAVGARSRHVLGYVLSQAVLVAVAGVAFGSWVGMMVWDAVRTVVAGLPSWDPGAVLRYGVLLAAAALAGALLPAWRAVRAAPATLFQSS